MRRVLSSLNLDLRLLLAGGLFLSILLGGVSRPFSQRKNMVGALVQTVEGLCIMCIFSDIHSGKD